MVMCRSSPSSITIPTDTRRHISNSCSNKSQQQQQQRLNGHQNQQQKKQQSLQMNAEFQNSRNSPLIDSSSPLHGGSPHSGASFPHAELDDYIIDEILSFEDDQLARRQQTGTPLSSSYSCSDNLTNLTNAIPVNSARSNAIDTTSSSPSQSGFQMVTSSAPTSSLELDSLVQQEVVLSEQEFFRDRRKKDIHNMIERRRRYNINDRIKELGQMLPKQHSEEIRLNKGTILKASCDYIRHLQKDREYMIRIQQQQNRMESTTRLYAQRIQELEEELRRSGQMIPPPSMVLPVIPAPYEQRRIKKEPTDEMVPLPAQCSPGVVTRLSDTTAALTIISTSPIHTTGNDSFYTAHSSDPSSSRYCTPFDSVVKPEAIPWTADLRHRPLLFPDLMMDLTTSIHTSGPLLQGDPMMSANNDHGHEQLSPDVQWDQAGFSPETDAQQQQQHRHNTQMDF